MHSSTTFSPSLTSEQISPSLLDRLLAIATPATFAVAASRHPKTGVSQWTLAKHLVEMDRLLMDAIRRPEATVVILEAPPRHGKSELISHYLPAWYLGRHPTHHVILTSYGDNLARKFGRRVRNLLDAKGELFGLAGINQDVSASNDWELNVFDGSMRTAGVGGPITGHGANLFIIDDYLKNAEDAVSEKVRDSQWEWFQTTAWTRMEPGATMVIMATRWHKDDLIGRIVKYGERELGVPIARLCMPALARAGDQLGREIGEPLWPERWPREVLEKRKSVLESYWWESLFQQNPNIYGAGEWPSEYFHGIESDDWPDAFEVSVVAVDPSKGKGQGDYSGIVHVGYARGRYWVDSVVRRLPVSAIVEAAVTLQQRYSADRLAVEGNGFQDLLAPEFERYFSEHHLPPTQVVLLNNSKTKELRISRLGPYLKQGLLRFRRGSEGNAILIDQLQGFPHADYDDGPDALEMAIRVLDSLTVSEADEGDVFERVVA